MVDSPRKQKTNRQDKQAERIRQILRDAGYDIRLNTMNRVRYTADDGHEFYFEVEELET